MWGGLGSQLYQSVPHRAGAWAVFQLRRKMLKLSTSGFIPTPPTAVSRVGPSALVAMSILYTPILSILYTPSVNTAVKSHHCAGAMEST